MPRQQEREPRMAKPIKILHVLSRMSRGGAEVRTMEILRHIDRRRYRFHFCTLSGLPGELDEEILALGGEIHPLRLNPVTFGRRFGRLLRQHRFDVVCSHLLYAAGFVLRLAARNKTPVRVAFLRSSHDGRGCGAARKMYRKLMHRWIDRYATHIVAVSEGVMAGVWGQPWRSDPRCEVIYDGIEPADFGEQTQRQEVRQEFSVPPDAPLYIHVGHLRPPKNHLRLIEVFAELQRRQPAARLLLVGKGGNQIERGVRQRLAELQIDNRVTFCRQRTDVPRLLKAADAMIFPSLWEGLPGAVLEACAAGTPVLASDLPGVREIAARLPQVRCLPLDAENAQWAQVAGEISRVQGIDAARREVRQSFAESVFTIDQCAQRHCRVWEGLGPEPSDR